MPKYLIYISLLVSILSSCGIEERNNPAINACNCDDLQLDLLYNHFFIEDRKLPYSGMCYKLNKNSDTVETINYNKGKVEGTLTRYFDSGTVKSETTFKHNKYDGDYREWDEEGNLIFHGIYKNGRFDSVLVDHRRK